MFGLGSPLANQSSQSIANAFLALHGNGQRYEYLLEIQQMMYVSGEVSNPLRETLILVEDLVRAHLVEIVAAASQISALRNSKSLIPEDILFVIRYAKTMVTRVKSYLSWKDVRRVQKSGGGAEAGPGGVPVVGVAGAGGGAGDDGVDGVMDVDDVIDEGDEPGAADAKLKPQRNMIPLPWDFVYSYSQCIEEEPLFNLDCDSGFEEEDNEEQEAYLHQMQRLKTADEYTRNMSQEEYIRYTECRQASFSYKRPARFLSWIGINNFVSGKPSSEVVDVLGFLGHEIVQRLAEEALIVKSGWDAVEQDWLTSLQPDTAEEDTEQASCTPQLTAAPASVYPTASSSVLLRDQLLALPEFSQLIFKPKSDGCSQSIKVSSTLPTTTSSESLAEAPVTDSNKPSVVREAKETNDAPTKEVNRRTPLLPIHILEAERRLREMWVPGALAFLNKGQPLQCFK